MHDALKNQLYKSAKSLLKENNKVYVWTAWDDSTIQGSTEIYDFNSLKRVFKYTYNMGWPIIRIK